MLNRLSALLIVIALFATVAVAQDDTFTLTVLHTNDTHARHAADGDGNGGAPILATVVDQIRAEEDNVLFMDAGDRFQGTLFHTVFVGDDQPPIMNALGYDVMTLGNHEFNHGDQRLAEVVEQFEFPVVTANVDFTDSPLAGLVQPFVILEVGGEQIGVIGLDTADTVELSSPGQGLVWRDDYAAVLNEQAAVLAEQGVNKIIALTHLGINSDLPMLEQLSGIDLVVGGHSHTLYSNQNNAFGEYPITATDADGNTVYYVQAGQYTQYLGRADIEFDAAGTIVDFEGDSIFLSRYIPADAEVQAIVDGFEVEVAALREQSINATTELNLVGDRAVCRVEECALGNLIADGMRFETGTDLAIMNGGGIREDIPEGEITAGEMLTTQPFGNLLSTLTVTGEIVIEALENGVSRIVLNDAGEIQRNGASGRFPQVSGMSFTYDPTQEAGSRIVEVLVDGEPIDPEAEYTLTVLNFVRGGGDGYSMFAEDVEGVSDVYDFGRVDWEVTSDYFASISPITTEDIFDDAAPRITSTVPVAAE